MARPSMNSPCPGKGACPGESRSLRTAASGLPSRGPTGWRACREPPPCHRRARAGACRAVSPEDRPMSALTHLALFLLGLAAGLGSPTAHLDRERTIVVTSRPPYYTPAALRVTVGEAVRWINPLPAERHGVREVEQ